MEGHTQHNVDEGNVKRKYWFGSLELLLAESKTRNLGGTY